MNTAVVVSVTVEIKFNFICPCCGVHNSDTTDVDVESIIMGLGENFEIYPTCLACDESVTVTL